MPRSWRKHDSALKSRNNCDKAESERVKLLLEKRKRERIFGVTVFLLGIIMLIAFAALCVSVIPGVAAFEGAS